MIESLLPKVPAMSGFGCCTHAGGMVDSPRALRLPPLFTRVIASRRVRWLVSVVLSARVLTVRVAGARRASSASKAGRQRAGALRTVRGLRASRWRIQERVVMGKVLSGRGG